MLSSALRKPSETSTTTDFSLFYFPFLFSEAILCTPWYIYLNDLNHITYKNEIAMIKDLRGLHGILSHSAGVLISTLAEGWLVSSLLDDKDDVSYEFFSFLFLNRGLQALC